MNKRFPSISQFLTWWLMTRGRDRVAANEGAAHDWLEVHELMPSKYSLSYLVSMGYLKVESVRYYSITFDGLELINRMNKRRKDAE
jgi:hypothetical protein